jgi:RNA polymerase sigma factor (sigma-70 family)
MAVLTISALTLTSNKYNFVRTAQLYREQKLLAGAKCGDAAAFNELFQPLAKGVFRIVYRITKNREDAEDALQDSCLRAWSQVKDLESRSRFSTWLTQIAINSALMILRKRRNSAEIGSGDSGGPGATAWYLEVADRAQNPEKHYLQQERKRVLRRAIRALRPSIRGVVEIQQLQEHSVRETARMMGITIGAAKTRLFHAQGRAPQRLGPKSNRKNNTFSERS